MHAYRFGSFLSFRAQKGNQPVKIAGSQDVRRLDGDADADDVDADATNMLAL